MTQMSILRVSKVDTALYGAVYFIGGWLARILDYAIYSMRRRASYEEWERRWTGSCGSAMENEMTDITMGRRQAVYTVTWDD